LNARMQDKVVIITGAASGLGEATSKKMLDEGAFVLLADIDRDRGRALAEALGQRANYVRCDVTSEGDVAGVVERAVELHGHLDCMFNNAGVVGASGPIDELTVDEFDLAVAVLLRSVFLGMKHAARVMKPRGGGVILSTTSVAGIAGGWAPHLYSAAKSGVVGLTRNVAAELAPYGVRCAAIAPGKIVTPMNAARAVGDPDDLEGLAAVFQTQTPLRGRVGLPEDVANAAVWLASDEAGFVSGTTVIVDGGLTTGSKENLSPADLGSWARRG